MSVYSQLAGDSNYDVMYTSESPVGDDGYPPVENYGILGPIYTPRIHGLGLNALEIASSDIVAFTLGGTHSLDLGRDTNSNVSYMRTVPNESLQVSLANGSASIFMDANDSNMELYAASNLTFNADGGVSIASANSPLVFRAGNEGSLTDRSELTLGEQGTFNVYASDLLDLQSSSNVLIRADDQVEIQKGSDLFMKFERDDTLSARAIKYDFEASDSFNFAIDGSSSNPVIKIERDLVTLHGNFDIYGTINSINQTVTQLEVQDKTLKLAVAGNDSTNIVDGVDNEHAGLIVAGYPAGADSNLQSVRDKYAKSIRWNHGTDGIDAMLTSNVDKESFWDVRGGSIRMTHYKADEDEDIGYGFRINGNDELEMVRHYEDDLGNKKTSQFIRFGRKTV